MGVELHPWGEALPSFPAGEALSANMVCMVSAGTTMKATAGAQLVGVALYDVDAGDPPTLHAGLVNVLTSASVSADADITVSATAGKVRTATAGERVIGKMIDTVSGAGTGRALIFPPGVGATALGLPSGGGEVAQIANAGVAYVAIGAAPVSGTITSYTLRFLGGITKGLTGVTASLYRVRAGVATKIAEDTNFEAADSNYTALADWALVQEVGAGKNALVAGDWLYLSITNNTGSAIDPYVAQLAIA